MGSEVLIYGYGLVCLAMLVFNVLYSVHLRGDAKRHDSRMKRIAAAASPGLAAAAAGEELPEGYEARLERLLLHVDNLVGFEEWLTGVERTAAERYLGRIAPVLTRLSGAYGRREEMQGAYYCYFIAAWGDCLGGERERAAREMVPYVRRRSLYCKVNALKALCALGEMQPLLEALAGLAGDGTQELSLHEKIIVEALMGFRGDADALIGELWSRFESFSVPVQRVLLDYIRFRSGGYGDQMLEVLLDDRRDKELRFAAIRYFGRYPDQRARASLLRFVSDPEPARWEYAAISATALGKYPGQDTVDALSGAMHSPNWYVRYNSASSLEQLGFTYEDLLGKAAGDDRYAREMLTYRLETRRLEERREEAAAV